MKTARAINLAGTRHGRLLVIGKVPTPEGVTCRDQFWSCVCDCGASCVKSAKNLRHGLNGIGTQSCGCFQRERVRQAASVNSVRHGHARVGKATKEYISWCAMIRRCTDPGDAAYPDYGGRGITVCERWRSSFQAFLDDMGPITRHGLSIDRYPDNNGGYEPGNCRWATMSEQSRNRRDRRPVTHNGRTMMLADWAAETGIGISTLHSRLYKYGWSVERTLTTNPKVYHKRQS